MELYIYEDYTEIFPEIRGRKLTDILIRKILEEYGVSDQAVLRTEKGKPYLASEERDNLYFSVSHSGRYFVCLVDSVPVGVDVQIQRKSGGEKISRRYFTPAEKKYVDENGEEGFLIIWTRKEAYSKFTGKGIEEIIKGTDVLERSDVEFTDIQLEKGVFCSCCRMI